MIPTLTRRRTLAPWQWLGLWAASLILTAVLLPVGIVQLRGTTGGAYAGAGNTASGQAASGQAASGPGVSGQAGLGNANTADPASSRAFPQAASQSQAANPKQIAHAPAHSADASTSNRDTAADADLPQDNLSVPVLSSQTGRVRHYALETYVAGVVAGEMLADFDPEALKAQAVAARTYAVYKWGQHAEGSGSDTESAPGVAGDPPSGKPGTSDNSGSAWSGNNALHDTVLDQDFLTDQELRKEWGSDYENYRKKILQAVTATQGKS